MKVSQLFTVLFFPQFTCFIFISYFYRRTKFFWLKNFLILFEPTTWWTSAVSPNHYKPTYCLAVCLYIFDLIHGSASLCLCLCLSFFSLSVTYTISFSVCLSFPFSFMFFWSHHKSQISFRSGTIALTYTYHYEENTFN